MFQVLNKIWLYWKKFAKAVGWVNLRLILTIVYIVLIAPVGLLMRLFGWDPLESSAFNTSKSSNWKKIEKGEPDLESLKRQS